MQTYKVLIHWANCGADFTIPVNSSADNPEEAARKRVAHLINPQNYTRVLVLDQQGEKAWIYPVQQFLDPGTQGASSVPQPRYGWRG